MSVHPGVIEFVRTWNSIKRIRDINILRFFVVAIIIRISEWRIYLACTKTGEIVLIFMLLISFTNKLSKKILNWNITLLLFFHIISTACCWNRLFLLCSSLQLWLFLFYFLGLYLFTLNIFWLLILCTFGRILKFHPLYFILLDFLRLWSTPLRFL